ncbi:MAG: hypothetical protein QXQ66_03680 [Candidatus Hadarchaeum sp.]|uniref:hypothetical protein n=1 Tax=Candidatus Hadarchaeum sp. TaxID=2883567 RepID=UPI0031802ADE
MKRWTKALLRRRSPWLAALLNFVVWGAGFVYLGRKVSLGAALLFFSFAMFFSAGLATYDFYLAVALVFAAWFLLSAALALEAYREARKGSGKGASGFGLEGGS